MAGETVAQVTMQQEERQHRSYRWWKQYAADPNDDASGLLMKRQKLLILRQAIAAYIGIVQSQNAVPVVIADPQDLQKPSAAAQQHHSGVLLQLANAAAAKPNVQLQCQNTVDAATAQQNHERVLASPQRSQQQQHEEHPGSKAHHHHQQQLHDEQHDRLSHRDLLCRLLGPAIPAAGGGGPSTAAEAAPDQQEHLEQQQQPWQRRKRQKPAAPLPSHLQRWPAQQKLQQAVQQRRQVQQTGGRRRMLQQQPSNLAHYPTEQQQRQGESSLQQQHQPEQHSRSRQQHQVQQLEQQQQQVRWVHAGNQLCDAQSQAVGPAAGAGSTAAATAVGSRLGFGAVQQLLSPRTAEHVPHADGVAWQISCAAEPLHMKQQQPLQHQQQSQQQPQHQQQQVWSQGRKGHKAAADKQQEQQQRFVCQQQLQQEEAARAASPPASPQQQTQLSREDHPSPPAAAEVVIASTPTPCKMVPGTPYSPEPAPDMTGGAAAAAAAAAAVPGDAGGDPCAVFGSYVAESPAAAAAAAAPRSVVKGPKAAAPAVDSNVAQRLFETPQGPLQQKQELRAMLPADPASAVAVSAVAAEVVVQADSRRCVVMQQQQQQQLQRGNGRHIGGKHRVPHATALLHTGAAAQAAAGQSISSSSSSVCLNVQQRSVQIDVGLPVTNIVTCQQQCLVIMQQHSSSSNRFELLHLQLQQQQEGWDIALGGSATVTVPEHRAGRAAAAAGGAAAALVDRGIKLLPVQQCVPDNDKAHNGDATYDSLLQGALIAAAAPLELATFAGHHSSTAAAPPAAAAVTPPGLGMQQPVSTLCDKVQELREPAAGAGIKTPGSGIRSEPPTGKRSLRSKLSNSSGKRNALHSRLGAAAAAAAAGDDTEHHGVNVYRLSRVAKGASSTDPKQQQQGTVVHVQRLATEVAVTCVAVCEHQLLLAAAGSAGYACVWKPNRCSSTSSSTQLQQQEPIITAASEDSRVVLPAAAYRGIRFPDITDLCFLLQPGSSSSSARVLLVGSCNQGSLAVWDVQLRQQIISVHNPDVNLHGLLPLQSPVSSSSSVVGSGTRGSCYAQQQQQQPDLLLLLALVGSKDNAGATTPTPLPTTAAAGSGVAGARLSRSTHQQQQQRHWPKRELELRPILLQQPGSLILGAPVLGTAQGHHRQQQQQQQQCSVAVQTAAVCGPLAAAAANGGDTGTSVKVWDLISGCTVATVELPGTPAAAAAAAASTAGDVLSVGLITTRQQIQQQQQQQHEVEDAGRHSCRDGVRGVVLMGLSSGILTMAML